MPMLASVNSVKHPNYYLFNVNYTRFKNRTYFLRYECLRSLTGKLQFMMCMCPFARSVKCKRKPICIALIMSYSSLKLSGMARVNERSHSFTIAPARLSTNGTRHRASTSMYSLTFRVCVTTPPQYKRNGTAHAAGASMLSPARGVFAGMRSVLVRHACGVWWAWRITAGLCHAFP